MIEVASLLSLLSDWHDPLDGEATKSIELTLLLLRESPAPFSRDQFTPGHITGSACVVHPDQSAVLLVHHGKLDRWLLPGGHTELPLDLQASDTARREAEEETGVLLAPDVLPLLVGVDVHGIPARKKEPFHLHHDLIFSFQARSAGFVESDEVRAIAWCTPQQFDAYDLPGSIRRAAARSLFR